MVSTRRATRVFEAAEAAKIVLPEHDYQVLRRWGDDRYWF